MIDDGHRRDARGLRCGVVLKVTEECCDILADGRRSSVGFAGAFPSPHTERVSPGHLVAVATTVDGHEVVVWRWYDAVVLADEGGLVRMWEPVHGEVLASPRTAHSRPPGTRAYLSAGLPGADWWVAGPATARAEEAEVDLDEVVRLFADLRLWDRLV